MFKKIKEAHTFFCRKSQHYILGNWNCYTGWYVKTGETILDIDGDSHWNEPVTRFNKDKLNFYLGFLMAYIRFMWFSLLDMFREYHSFRKYYY